MPSVLRRIRPPSALKVSGGCENADHRRVSAAPYRIATCFGMPPRHAGITTIAAAPTSGYAIPVLTNSGGKYLGQFRWQTCPSAEVLAVEQAGRKYQIWEES